MHQHSLYRGPRKRKERGKKERKRERGREGGKEEGKEEGRKKRRKCTKYKSLRREKFIVLLVRLIKVY